MTMYDVDPTELIEEVAKELAKVDTVKPPEWASFVKTGTSRERPPVRKDWWYVRAASVLRKVRIKGPIGISKLKVLYGGKKNRGHQPEQFREGSGNILRKILQQLEKTELVKKDKKGVHKGRVITPKGIKLIDNVAKKIVGNKPVESKPEVKPIETKKEKKKETPKSQKSKISEGLETKSQSTTEAKTEDIVKKAKEFAQGKAPTAKKLIEEATKKEVPKK